MRPSWPRSSPRRRARWAPLVVIPRHRLRARPLVPVPARTPTAASPVGQRHRRRAARSATVEVIDAEADGDRRLWLRCSTGRSASVLLREASPTSRATASGDRRAARASRISSRDCRSSPRRLHDSSSASASPADDDRERAVWALVRRSSSPRGLRGVGAARALLDAAARVRLRAQRARAALRRPRRDGPRADRRPHERLRACRRTATGAAPRWARDRRRPASTRRFSSFSRGRAASSPPCLPDSARSDGSRG